MSAHLVLHCEHPDCTALVHLFTTDTERARRVAARGNAWSWTPTSGDRCPTHSTRKAVPA